MNNGYFKPSIIKRLKNIIIPDDIMTFLKLLRKCQYYSTLHTGGGKLKFVFFQLRLKRIQRKLGFSIGFNVFGYGLVIPHYGTIVVGGSNRIGNYAVLHTSTCISNNGKIIGDGLYLATGVKMTRKVTLGDYVSVAANSVVNSDCLEGNCLLAGIPAQKKKDVKPWYIRDGELYHNKVLAIEKLKQEMGL